MDQLPCFLARADRSAKGGVFVPNDRWTEKTLLNLVINSLKHGCYFSEAKIEEYLLAYYTDI